MIYEGCWNSGCNFLIHDAKVQYEQAGGLEIPDHDFSTRGESVFPLIGVDLPGPDTAPGKESLENRRRAQAVCIDMRDDHWIVAQHG